MKILQINTVDTRGGAAKVAYRLKNGLNDLGHKADMIVARKYSQDTDVHLLRPYSRLREKIVRKLTYWLADDLDFSPSKHIRKIQSYREADIINLHNIHSNYFNLGTLPLITRDKPTVWTLHDMWALTAHCGYAMGSQTFNGFFQCQDLNSYPPIAWHNEKYLEWKKRKIYKQSNSQALKNNPNVLCLIIGGDQTVKTSNLIKTGYIDDESLLAKYFSAADIFLFPSTADNCPLVVLEALACGLPVVSFATGGIPELVEHQKIGYIARYKDSEDLAAGVRWMLTLSPAERNVMREAAVSKILSGFTLDHMTKQYLELYESMLKTRRENP